MAGRWAVQETWCGAQPRYVRWMYCGYVQKARGKQAALRCSLNWHVLRPSPPESSPRYPREPRLVLKQFKPAISKRFPKIDAEPVCRTRKGLWLRGSTGGQRTNNATPFSTGSGPKTLCRRGTEKIKLWNARPHWRRECKVGKSRLRGTSRGWEWVCTLSFVKIVGPSERGGGEKDCTWLQR